MGKKKKIQYGEKLKFIKLNKKDPSLWPPRRTSLSIFLDLRKTKQQSPYRDTQSTFPLSSSPTSTKWGEEVFEVGLFLLSFGLSVTKRNDTCLNEYPMSQPCPVKIQ